MQRRACAVLAMAALAAALGCGSAPPPPAAPHPEEEPEEAQVIEPQPVGGQDAGPLLPAPPSPPASTATYEQALAEPEPLDANDSRAHLTDLQLTNPMRNVMGRCPVPRRGKLTIKVTRARSIRRRSCRSSASWKCRIAALPAPRSTSTSIARVTRP